MEISLAELRVGQETVYKYLLPTAQICWPALCEQIGCRVWLKHENHQVTSAFKVRGGLTYLEAESQKSTLAPGVICATKGNHGQSVAYASAALGVPTTIVVPRGNSREKNSAMRAFGGNLLEYGEDFTESLAYAKEKAARDGWHFLPSFHPQLLIGVASYWLELLESLPQLDVVYVPIGLGSGICSGIIVRNALGLKTEIVGVVAEAAPAYLESFSLGQAVSAPSKTVIADGLAVRTPDPVALEMILKNVSHIVAVSDEEIREAMRIIFSTTHNCAEGAAAATIAAVMKENSLLRGKCAAAVITGGNVDRETFAKVLFDRE